MWANAQRDVYPAEYRWRPLFNATKFGWRPLLECRAVTLPRRETRWNWLGCPKLTNRSQPLVGRTSPYCKDMWRSYCCLTSFFPDCRYMFSCEDMARQSCAMVPRWRIFGDFLRPVFSASRVQHVSDLHRKFATTCASTVDIQSVTSESRRGKKRKKKKKKKIEEETTTQKYNGVPYSIGRP